MSAALSSPMTQLTFAWAEPETMVPPAVIAPKQRIPLGVAARPVAENPSVAASSKPIAARIGPSRSSEAPRRGKTEHISDLLLVVLDRYGIDPNEFLAGLE